MLNNILKILGINKLASPDLLKKGLEKVDPRFKKFFSETAKYGYPIGATIGFLKSEFTGANEPEVNQNLRPDQAANQQIQSQKDMAGRLGGTLGNVALGAGLGALGGRALGAIGSTLGQAAGGEQNEPQAEAPEPMQTENPTQPGGVANFIGQHPELGAFVDQLIQKGEPIELVAQKARSHRKFAPIVQQIEQSVGQDFASILSQLWMGYGQQPKQSAPAAQQASQGSPDQQALLQAIQQLNALKQARK